MTADKKRHGCLTTWLILMLIGNSGTALLYLFGSEALRQTIPNAPAWVFSLLIVMSLCNLACTIALFNWKKWGFWGFCATSVIALAINLSIGLGVASSLSGLLGVILLYGVLQIGKEKKGWSQLT